jgi:hypothetical protein
MAILILDTIIDSPYYALPIRTFTVCAKTQLTPIIQMSLADGADIPN